MPFFYFTASRGFSGIRDLTDPTTATSMKTSLRNRLRILSNRFAIIPSRPNTLKKREFMLELKRGGRTRVQREMVEFIALPFPS